MTRYEDAIRAADWLTMGEKVRLLEHLSASLRHALEIEAFQRMPWHEFVERTAGILADEPIERPPQLPLEAREPIGGV